MLARSIIRSAMVLGMMYKSDMWVLRTGKKNAIDDAYKYFKINESAKISHVLRVNLFDQSSTLHNEFE